MRGVGYHTCNPFSGPRTGRDSAERFGSEATVELAEPIEPSSLAGADLAKNGEIMHSATWKVVDMERAVRHLEANGIIVLDRDDTTVVADPATTFGALFRFTTRQTPGS